MGTSIPSNSFCKFVFDCNLYVLEPTHIKGNILDLVLTSASVFVSNLTILVINFSNHHAISFKYSCHASSPGQSTLGYVFNFCKTDYSSISSFLLDSDFSTVFESINIEFIWLFIKSLIYEAMPCHYNIIIFLRCW